MSNAAEQIDLYKMDHRSQYPNKTELVFSNWTPRSSRKEGIDRVVFFGLQYFILDYLIEEWNRTFFDLPAVRVVDDYRRHMKSAGFNLDLKHLKDLHELGHLPLKILALPEGSRVPTGVPMYVVWSTDNRFSWLTNYLESVMSCEIWGPCTTATLAYQYRKTINHYMDISGGDSGFTSWQGHDFSFRGMWGRHAAAASSAGHLLSFTGTDTFPAIPFLEKFYGANCGGELIGGSIPATEHSVMCMGGQANELETLRRLMTEVYPEGPISIVCDTWDYWKIWTEYLPQLKDIIMARKGGPVVIRPDSGDPVKIICGDPAAPEGSPEFKGSFQLAWELFGGTVNDKGFKQLDPHINLIYGDSITLERCDAIMRKLVAAGFVPSLVLGIGSFSYQYNTRDTFGFAMKATAGVVDDKLVEIFKDPATDDGIKKSAKGLLAVYETPDGSFELKQQATWEEVADCAFVEVFCNGEATNFQTLKQIRERLHPTPVAAV
jgi:nicotinamide phosphoribosyltransferase